MRNFSVTVRVTPTRAYVYMAKSWTWIWSIHGLDFIGLHDYDPFLKISRPNHCSAADAVSFKLWSM